MTTVSVILPTYNRQVWVCNAIDSVLAQRRQPDEIVVIDDGSTDNTAEVLKSYGSAIRVISQPNRGVAAARNAGLLKAHGEWLAFIDSDDEWHPRYLETQVRALAQAPEAVLSVTDAHLVGHDHPQKTYFELNGIHYRWGMFQSRHIPQSDTMAFLIRHLPWQLGAVLVRRDTCMRAGLFDETLPLSEDVEWLARVARHGAMVLTDQALLEVYRRHGTPDGLSDPQVLTPLQARSLNDKAYRRWLRLPDLSLKERRAVKKRIAANSVSLAHLLASSEHPLSARHWYGQSIRTWPNAAAIIGWARQWRWSVRDIQPAMAHRRQE